MDIVRAEMVLTLGRGVAVLTYMHLVSVIRKSHGTADTRHLQRR
jgi:hypothetical protein